MKFFHKKVVISTIRSASGGFTWRQLHLWLSFTLQSWIHLSCTWAIYVRNADPLVGSSYVPSDSMFKCKDLHDLSIVDSVTTTGFWWEWSFQWIESLNPAILPFWNWKWTRFKAEALFSGTDTVPENFWAWAQQYLECTIGFILDIPVYLLGCFIQWTAAVFQKTSDPPAPFLHMCLQPLSFEQETRKNGNTPAAGNSPWHFWAMPPARKNLRYLDIETSTAQEHENWALQT